jgi:phospholipid-binding lipoprotein MlaA
MTECDPAKGQFKLRHYPLLALLVVAYRIGYYFSSLLTPRLMWHRGCLGTESDCLAMPNLRRAGAVLSRSMLAIAMFAATAKAGPDVASTSREVGVEDAEEAEIVGFPDPLEGLNRQTLRVNQGIDHWLFDPITTVYRGLVPEVGRRAVRNVLANLDTPAVLVNDLLQLEFRQAAVTTARFIANSTWGVAGLLDIGTAIGLEGHRSDFGQTLARFGVGSGPYLVLPVLGPTTLRDGTGSLVDFLFRPTTYILAPVDQFLLTTLHGSSSGLATLDSQADGLDMLEASSIDFYAALRSAYYQNRMAEIRAPDSGV